MVEAILKNTLLVQFPANTNPSYDRVMEIENTLIQAFEQNRAAVVDGHDFGDTANIFIFPNGPWDHCIEVVMAYLKLKKALGEVLVIKRLKSEKYEVVWPQAFTSDFERA
jgi:predicted P-loop ATPase/GTPase